MPATEGSSVDSDNARAEAGSEAHTQAASEPVGPSVTGTAVVPEVAEIASPPPGGVRSPGALDQARLEQEGEIAADYLEGLLDIADLDGDIDMDVENERAAVSIVAGEESAG